MANGATLGELRTLALDYADMTGSSYPVTARVNEYINAGASDLYDTLADAGYFAKSQNVSVVGGTESYSLPSDFYRCLEVSWISGNRRFPLARYERNELHGVHQGPRASGTVQLDYVPHFTRFSADSDTIDTAFANGGQVPNEWEDYIALHAAIRLLVREESDASQLMAERERVAQKIINSAEPRDFAGRVGDVYGRYSNWYYPTTALKLVYRIIGGNIHFLELGYWGA